MADGPSIAPYLYAEQRSAWKAFPPVRLVHGITGVLSGRGVAQPDSEPALSAIATRQLPPTVLCSPDAALRFRRERRAAKELLAQLH